MNSAISIKPKKPRTTKDTYVSTTGPKKGTNLSNEEPVITVSKIITAAGSFVLGNGGIKDGNKKKGEESGEGKTNQKIPLWVSKL
jgi:hypothetical protein